MCSYSTLQTLVSYSLKQLHQFIPQQQYRSISYYFFLTDSAFDSSFVFFFFLNPVGIKCHVLVILICKSLMTNMVEHIFSEYQLFISLSDDPCFFVPPLDCLFKYKFQEFFIYYRYYFLPVIYIAKNVFQLVSSFHCP